MVVSSTSSAVEGSSPWWGVWDAYDLTAQANSQLFTENEKRILSDYLQSFARAEGKNDTGKGHKKQKPLPPGLQKKLARGGTLPPGWQKKVERGQVLDRDLYAISSTLPPGVAKQLERHEGTSVRQIENRVVRIIDATSEILDVIKGQ